MSTIDTYMYRKKSPDTYCTLYRKYINIVNICYNDYTISIYIERNHMSEDEIYMQLALEKAHQAYALDEVPIGAVIIYNGQVISAQHNRRELDHDATAHAEILAIQEACKKLNRWRLTGCSLYVTIEPCPMCAGAIVNSRISRVIYGSSDYKGGAVESLFNILTHPGLNHEPEIVSGILADECSQIMKRFFKERRKSRRSTQVAEGSALEMR